MIKTVGVIGAGVMGHGIAELCAISGYDVILNDVNDEILQKGLEKIHWSLERLGKRGEIPEDPETIFKRIETCTDLSEFSRVDLVIEAVKEKTEVKRQVLSKLDSVVSKECILSSNTSTIPISELASMTKREGKFIGLHFSNPPVLMPIVEIIKGDKTNEGTLKKCQEFVSSLKKESVVVMKDIPGFLINRLNDRVISESMAILEEGIPKEVLDAVVRFRLGFPMGICELLDFVGIDTVYNANREMIRRGFNSRPSDILKEKVENDKLGAKTGEGFYKYEKLGEYVRPFLVPIDSMYELSPLRLLSVAINEAAWLLRNEVATQEDIEKAMKLAMNWPHGPLEYADRYGVDEVVRELRKRWAATGESRYSPDPVLIEMVEKDELGLSTGKGFSVWRHSEDTYGSVVYSTRHDYALVELNRPDRLNSLDEASWKGLRDALETARNDPGVRSVVITGRGRAFCAGDDIAMMDSWKGATDANAWMTKFADPLVELLSDYPKPIISVINGLAFGGGCELNMLFDIVISSDKAIFALPEGLIGAMPPVASSYGVAVINRKLTRYALTGEWFSAKIAKELDMVDIIVPHDQLNHIIPEFTEKLSGVAPLSSRTIKSSINLVRQSFRAEAQHASNELVFLASTRDFFQGQKAFLRKEKPKWEGN